MMIPELDLHGLLPQGVHDCSLDEIVARFAWNAHRVSLANGLRRFIDEELRPLGLLQPLYVDGSFTRSKENPEDIDVVIDLDGAATDAALASAFKLCTRRAELKAAYTLDVVPRHSSFPMDCSQFFQYVGVKAAAELGLLPSDRKGVLRLILT